jgi:Na+-driven multidrug efflux pump
LAEIGLLLKIGLGAFLNQVGFSFLALLVNLSIKKYGTALDLSVFGIISRILIFITMPLTGIGQGVQAVAGFNYGAGHLKRVKYTVHTGYVFTVVFGALLFVILFFFPQSVLTLFTKSHALIAAATEPLHIATWVVPLIGIQIVTYFYYIAVHHARNSILTSICRQIIFITPFIVILPYFYGMNGIWGAFPLSDLISAAACLLLVRLSFKQFTPPQSVQESIEPARSQL